METIQLDEKTIPQQFGAAMRYVISLCKRGTQQRIAERVGIKTSNLTPIIKDDRGTQEHVRRAIFQAMAEQVKLQHIDFPIIDPMAYGQFLRFGDMVANGIRPEDAIISWRCAYMDTHKPPTARMVPILGRVPAGRPDQMREQIIGWEPVDASIPRDCYAIRVSGNSMLRPDGGGIRDGDVVFFVEESHPAHNDVVVVNNEFGDSMLKRLKIRENGEFVLTSDNPIYEPVRPNEEYRIVGKVIDVRRQPDWK